MTTRGAKEHGEEDVHPGPRRFGEDCVRVLEHDPELGLRVPAALITRARAELVAPARWVQPGLWQLAADPDRRADLGYLVLDGVLARDVMLTGTICTELLGEGDLVQPAVSLRDETLIRYRVLWHVLDPVRVAVLDEHFARSLGEWPQVMNALLERALRRAHRTAIHQALLQLSPVETRLLVLFWHLAERWGRVTPAGIVIRLRLPHRLLGQLVGCRRASVTTALQRIASSGLVERRADCTWLLHGSPPDEIIKIRWEARNREQHHAGAVNSAGH